MNPKIKDPIGRANTLTRLKARLKRGPRMTKAERGEYLLRVARVMGLIQRQKN
jgi:hypothetical protein